MTIIVTGAVSFIGSNIVRHLISAVLPTSSPSIIWAKAKNSKRAGAKSPIISTNTDSSASEGTAFCLIKTSSRFPSRHACSDTMNRRFVYDGTTTSTLVVELVCPGRTHSLPLCLQCAAVWQRQSSAKSANSKKNRLMYSNSCSTRVLPPRERGLTTGRLPAASTLRTTEEQHKGRMASSPSCFHQYRELTVASTCSAAMTVTAADRPRLVSVRRCKSTSTSSTIPTFASTASVASQQLTNSPPPSHLPPPKQAWNELERAGGRKNLSATSLPHDALKGKYELHPSRHHQIARSGYRKRIFDVKSGVDRYVKWMLERWLKHGW